MPGGRAYDYSAPFFGGFTCLPPASNTTRADRAGGYASSRQDSINRSRSEYASSRQSSFARTDSLTNQRSLARGDSLTGSSRAPMTRMDSLGRSSVTTDYTSTSSYKSPYSSR